MPSVLRTVSQNRSEASRSDTRIVTWSNITWRKADHGKADPRHLDVTGWLHRRAEPDSRAAARRRWRTTSRVDLRTCELARTPRNVWRREERGRRGGARNARHRGSGPHGQAHVQRRRGPVGKRSGSRTGGGETIPRSACRCSSSPTTLGRPWRSKVAPRSSLSRTGLESALAQARQAAGDKDVAVAGGANVVQQCLNAGLLDQMQIHLVPAFLGEGVRLFDQLGDSRRHLKSREPSTPRRDPHQIPPRDVMALRLWAASLRAEEVMDSWGNLSGPPTNF